MKNRVCVGWPYLVLLSIFISRHKIQIVSLPPQCNRHILLGIVYTYLLPISFPFYFIYLRVCVQKEKEVKEETPRQWFQSKKRIGGVVIGRLELFMAFFVYIPVGVIQRGLKSLFGNCFQKQFSILQNKISFVT